MILTLKKAQWTEGAAEWLRPACDNLYPLYDLARDVDAGQCTLFNVNSGDEHVASFVLRFDGEEIVIVAAGGYLPGLSLYETITPFIERLAKACGAKYLRGHTRRAGIGRKMEKVGFTLSEWVYRKEIA